MERYGDMGRYGEMWRTAGARHEEASVGAVVLDEVLALRRRSVAVLLVKVRVRIRARDSARARDRARVRGGLPWG